jgi:hypothetical protein
MTASSGIIAFLLITITSIVLPIYYYNKKVINQQHKRQSAQMRIMNMDDVNLINSDMSQRDNPQLSDNFRYQCKKEFGTKTNI